MLASGHSGYDGSQRLYASSQLSGEIIVQVGIWLHISASVSRYMYINIATAFGEGAWLSTNEAKKNVVQYITISSNSH